MIIKINSTPVDFRVAEDGVSVGVDLTHIPELIQTPVNVDIAYAGHHLINGDINPINFWVHNFNVAADNINSAIDFVSNIL